MTNYEYYLGNPGAASVAIAGFTNKKSTGLEKALLEWVDGEGSLVASINNKPETIRTWLEMEWRKEEHDEW